MKKYTICIDETVKIRHLVEVEAEEDEDVETALDMLDDERLEDFDSVLYSLRNNYEEVLKVIDFNRNYSENVDEIEYDYYDDDLKDD